MCALNSANEDVKASAWAENILNLCNIELCADNRKDVLARNKLPNTSYSAVYAHSQCQMLFIYTVYVFYYYFFVF